MVTWSKVCFLDTGSYLSQLQWSMQAILWSPFAAFCQGELMGKPDSVKGHVAKLTVAVICLAKVAREIVQQGKSHFTNLSPVKWNFAVNLGHTSRTTCIQNDPANHPVVLFFCHAKCSLLRTRWNWEQEASLRPWVDFWDSWRSLWVW